MVYYKFLREKNADYFDKNLVTIPSKENLKQELVKKMEEKISMFDVVFDKFARDVYLKSKNKTIPNDVSESEIQKTIALRVVVDYFDLIYSLAKVENINKEKLFNHNNIFENIKHIKHRIFKTLFLLKQKETTEELLCEFMRLIMSFANYFEFDIKLIDEELENINKKEGSFYDGKIVKFE